MIELSPELATLLSGALGFSFTVAILSYLLGDNPLYRLALHLFIGTAVGYAALIAIHQVLVPRLVEPLTRGNLSVAFFVAVPLVLFIFLAFKLSPRLSGVGNITVALMLGVGTAIAIAGALRGTLLPQVQATQLSVSPTASGSRWLDNLIVVVGTACSLLYFQFWVRARPATDGAERSLPMRVVAGVGHVFIVLALGATYAGIILSGISLFSERVVFLWNFISRLLG